MNHADDDHDDIVLDDVADEDEGRNVEHQKEQQQQPPQPNPPPSSPLLPATTVEEDDDEAVPVEDEDYYSGPNKVLRLSFKVPSGSLLNSDSLVNGTAPTSSAEVPAPTLSSLPQQPPPSLLASSSKTLFGFFRELHREICQLSAPLLVLLFAYLVVLMYVTLL